MSVLVIVLNKVEYLDELLAKFIEIGIQGATLLDSQGMAGVLADSERDVPIFGLFKTLMEGSKPYNKTIFTVLEDEKLLESAIQAVTDVLGENCRSGAVFMFTLPLGNVYRFVEPQEHGASSERVANDTPS